MSIHQDFHFEASFWGDCTNTYAEEMKQYMYGEYMGLEIRHHWFMAPRPRILDVGGGPVSMLLKTWGLKEGLVWDPLPYPSWTDERYKAKNIRVRRAYGEDLDESGWDEVWMYNCLQHTTDPAKIIRNCLRAGRVFRIFEWIDIPAYEGHPQMLTKPLLDEWIGIDGKTAQFVNQVECTGRAYFATVQTGA